MRQPEKFISISYPHIDFLIPNDYVISSVGVKDLDMANLQSEESGIYDFDKIAAQFMQIPHESDIRTMIVLKSDYSDSSNSPEQKHISTITTRECKVCTIHLNELSLFSDFYSEQFQRFGLLACNFENDRIKLLLDVKQIVNYLNDSVLEEL